ncbi:GTPase IMAP family member 5-like [Puntigrus tetrazona]|uniref:GTPase IMAP family member 5-like n=1 Tax=Puntigrus tetrazona TaxID=1606681 RepID=UPI001C8921D9|nr:GTPase IMAP family member 5-like [Puntigrus tetrazona]
MSDLRVVLLGKNRSENRRVAKALLDTIVFDGEAPSHSLQDSEKITGVTQDRKISVVINTHLLQTHLSHQQVTHRVRECVRLSAPGPQVILLVLQRHDFGEDDRHRAETVLKLFGKRAVRHTIVLTTDEEARGAVVTPKSNAVRDLITECGGGHLRFDAVRAEFFKKTQEILLREREEYLICGTFEDEDLKESTESRAGGGL